MSQNQKDGSDKPLGKSTNDCGHENNGNDLNELVTLKAKVQLLETENKQLVEANKQLEEEKKIQDDKYRHLEKEMREKSLKRKLQESHEEFAERKFRSLKENHRKEIAEWKVKLTAQNEVFVEKLQKLEEMIQTSGQKISEIENEIVVSMHEMKVQLPLENWHDLLAFVPRSQLGNAVSQIGDRQFARIIQSFLHDDVKQITLGDMRIIPPRWHVPSDQPMVHVWPNAAATFMPYWPMPGNIRDFKEINLSYVDMSVLNFLRKFQENSLLTDVNLQFGYDIEEHILLQVLTQILPLISSIDSISMASSEIDLFNMVYNDKNGYGETRQLLLMEMMAKTRILWPTCSDSNDPECSWEDKMGWCCSWLNTPRDDGKPRMIKFFNSIYKPNEYFSFIGHIKKDFQMANHPASFFIHVGIGDNDVPDISFENVKTKEKLVFKTEKDGYWKKLLISRHPSKAIKSCIEANEKEIIEWGADDIDFTHKRYINFKDLRIAM